MKKNLLVILVVLILLGIGVDYLLLKTYQSTPQTVLSFSTDSGHKILITGTTDRVDVVTASDDYYRFKSSGYVVEGMHITGDYFQNFSTIQAGQWIIESGDTVSFTVYSPVPITVTLVATVTYTILVILTTLLVLMWIFEMIYAILF